MGCNNGLFTDGLQSGRYADSKLLQNLVFLIIMQLGSSKRAVPFLLLTLLLLIDRAQSAIGLQLVLSTSTINTNSAYRFTIVDDNLKNYDGTISITFPTSDYTISGVTVTDTNNSSKIYTHTVTSSSIVSFSYTRPTTPIALLYVTISSIMDPSSVKTVSIVYAFAATGVSSTATANFNGFASGNLTSCSLTFSPSTTHTIGVATLLVTIKNPIPSGGSVVIEYPSAWANPSTGSYPPLASTSSTCTKISGSLTSTISCDVIGNKLSANAVISPAMAASSSFSFSMSNIRSPPTSYSGNLVTVTTSTPDNVIDTSTSCTVTAVSAQTLTITSTSAFSLGVTGQLLLSWVTNSPLKVGDIITLTFPTSYMTFQSNTNYLSSNSTYIYSTIGSPSTYVKTFTITAFDTVTQIPSGNTIILNSIYAKCLIDTSARSISVAITRNSYSISSGTVSVAPAAGSLSSVSISADLTVVSQAATFSFTFTITNELKSTGSVKIQIPSSIQLTGSQPTCTVSSTTNPSALTGVVTTCSLATQIITISGFLSSDLASSAVLKINIGSALKNPLTTQPTAVFIISTESAAGNKIDSSSSATYTATVGTIGSLTITPTSKVVGATTLYTILYTMTRTIKSGSQFVLTIPSEISISSSPSYTYSLNGGSFSAISPTSVSNANSTITLTFTGMITTDLVSTNTITIKITSLINPLSMQASSTFIAKTTNSGYDIEYLASGLTIQNTDLSSFKDISQAVTEPTNGAQQGYNFYIKLNIPLAAGDQILIDIVNATSGVNQLTFSDPILGCKILYGINTLTNGCFLLNSRLTVTLSGALTDTTGTTQYQLVVQNVKMARTMAATSSFTITSMRSTGYSVSTSTVAGIVNKYENNIVSLVLTITTSPSQLNQAQSFKLDFTTFNGLYLLLGDYVVITIPQSYTYIGGASPAAICSNANFTCSFYNSDDHSIKVSPSGSFTSTALRYTFSVTIVDGLYKSPLDFSYSSDYFYINTYTSSGSAIDQTDTTQSATSATFYRTCGGYCKTCSPSNTSYCLSCYTVQGSLNYGGFNYMTSDGNCVDECGGNYYNNSGVCTPCDSPCYSCQANALDCTSCVTGYFYDSTETVSIKCKSSCPNAYYGDSSTNTCKACNSLCATCTTTSITCTSCASGTYLSGTQCKTSCPSGTYADTTLNQCKTCDISCDGCTINSTNCDACKSTYYLSGDVCVTDCPTGTVKNTASGVCECASQCATCEGSLITCTACSDPTQVLYENSCLSSCPTGSYLPTSETECETCVYNQCSKCDDTECTICNSGYYLHFGGCLSACPTGYYKNSGACSDCGSGCSYCEDADQCLTCESPYLKQESVCVTSCGPSYINFNATQCVSQCPIGYQNTSGKCQSNSDNGGSSTSTVAVTTTTGRVIPFPYTIAYILLAAVCIGMKCLYPYTMLPSAIMSIGSVLEILSAVTLLIASFVEFDQLRAGAAVILVVLIVIYICNFINLFLIIKILNNDSKFLSIYKKTVCANIIIRCISITFYHRFHEIVFSNIFGSRALSNKVEYVRKLYPFNILLIISIVFSIIGIGGAGVLSYSVQSLKTSSATFIWSIDLMVVWILNVIATILVLRRKESDYEKDPDSEQAKRYQTQQQLNFQNDSSAIDEVFIEESRVQYANQSGAGQSRKNYFYQNSKRQPPSEDPYETPLNRKKTGRNPINSNTGLPGGMTEESSEALCFGRNGEKKKIDEQSHEDLQEIILEEPVRDNLTNVAHPGRHNSPNKGGAGNDNVGEKINYEGYDLDPKLLQIPENSEEFKKLPPETRSKIRLAKANLHINKNSKNLATIGDQQLDEIQLSPKKKPKGEQKGGSDSSPEKGKSKSKGKGSKGSKLSKSTQKQKGSLSKQKDKLKNKNTENIDLDLVAIEGSPSERMVRNRSEQMRKKGFKEDESNGTQSQNIKKKNKKKKMVLYPDSDVDQNGHPKDKANGYEEEQEPTLPIFKHRKGQERYGTDEDGLDIIAENDLNENRGNSKGKNLVRSHSTGDHNNLKGLTQQRSNQVAEQQPDNLPMMHSSDQINNLIINKSNSPKKRSDQLDFSNDDESIYKKIYNDETETLRSVQGDNFFGQDISPSQFNIQNQRFEDLDTSNDMPVKPLITGEFNADELDDGFDDMEPSMRRYGSTKNNLNIDYDLVREKRQDSNRIKQLEKIYLPRLEVRPPRRKK